MRTRLTDLVGIATPIIQAPMAGVSTVALVAAACEAGALGSFGAAFLSGEQIRETVASVREHTRKPFAINLFAPVALAPVTGQTPQMIELVAKYCQTLGIAAPTTPALPADLLPEQIEAVLAVRPAVFSFTFGLIDEAVLAQCRERGILTIGTATTVREAVALAASGVDAVAAQGAEAGGHRGTFLGDFESARIGTMALVPQIVDAVGVPVIAAGGIMDGRGVAAALCLGAQAAQLGTAFLTTHESGANDAYKSAILQAQGEQTRLTRAFSGRPARGIVNAFMNEADAQADNILPYPLQRLLTRPMTAAGVQKQQPEVCSLWAGQAASRARREPVNALMQRLLSEMQATFAHNSPSA